MPFVFVVFGLVLLVSAIRGTQGTLFAVIKAEFWGTNSFVPWAAAIMIIGAIGYARPVRPIADAMIGLIILSMILGNKGGFFKQINQGLDHPVSPATSPSPAGYTPAGAALAGTGPTTLAPATANPDAASLDQGLPLGEPPAPAQPTSTVPWWQRLFGSSPAY